MTTGYGVEQDIEEPQRTLPRVAVFVTHEQGRNVQLLLRQRDNAYAQLPDADVQLYEAPADAALRLTKSDGQVMDARLVRRIAVVRERLPHDTRIMLRPVFLRTGPSFGATLMRFTMDRGLRVRLIESQDEFARVTYDEVTLRDNELAIVTRRSGWVTADALASQIEHHLYLVRASPTQPGQHGDMTASSRLLWVPLAQVPPLIDIHQEWLERARPLLQR